MSSFSSFMDMFMKGFFKNRFESVESPRNNQSQDMMNMDEIRNGIIKAIMKDPELTHLFDKKITMCIHIKCGVLAVSKTEAAAQKTIFDSIDSYGKCKYCGTLESWVKISGQDIHRAYDDFVGTAGKWMDDAEL